MITKLYHAPTVLVPFSFFLQRVVERKHYHPIENGAVERGLEPERFSVLKIKKLTENMRKFVKNGEGKEGQKTMTTS